jgi:ribonuclease P protein subunit RPR2
MAKIKTLNGSAKVPNKAIHSRVSFLFQAASYLATSQPPKDIEQSTKQATAKVETVEAAPNPISRRLASDLRSVTLKAQLRISPQMKHAICKNCDTILIDGTTCTAEVENKSKGGKKSWADVLARRCNICGVAKRYPLTAPRQKRRPLRTHVDVISTERPQTG